MTSERTKNKRKIYNKQRSCYLTWILHEFTHWLTSESFGYDSIMSLNSVSKANGR